MKNPILFFLLFFIVQIVHAEEATGPHGGQVVRSEAHQFEVKIDPNGKIIEIYTLLNVKKPAPKNMSITLFRESGSSQVVTLNAVNLKDPLPKYQGELSLTSGSYIGAELRFEINLKSSKVLKFKPYIPNRVERF